MPKYRIVSTTPQVYQAKDNTIVNGVLVRFNMLDYDEVQEIRVPKMDVNLVKSEIEAVIAARDEIASLGDDEE